MSLYYKKIMENANLFAQESLLWCIMDSPSSKINVK